MQPVPTCNCDRCGAPLTFEGGRLTASVRCDHCGAQVELTPDLLGRVRGYLQELRALWADELEARWRALLAEQDQRGMQRSMRWLPLLIVAISASCGVAFGDVGTHSVALNVTVIAIWLFAYGIVFSGIGPECPTVTQVLASGLGGCWSCGAPIRFEEGTAVAECRHCGSNAVIDGELRCRMLRVAAERLSLVIAKSERAALERAASREHAGALYGFWGKTSVAIVHTVMAVALLGGFFVFLGVTGKLGTRGPVSSAWVAPTMIVATVLVTVALGLWFRARAHRRAQSQRELEAMTGRPLHRPTSAEDRQRMAEDLVARMFDDETR